MRAGPTPCAATAEIEHAVEALRVADARLEALLGGAVDSVTAGDGKTFLLQRVQERLLRSDREQRDAILAALPANVALLDGEGIIVSVNAAWKQFADENGLRLPNHGLGASYLDACAGCTGADGPVADQAAHGIRDLLRAGVGTFELNYACNSPTQDRWFLLRACALANGALPGAVVSHHDITPQIQTASKLARLALETGRRERMLHTALSSISDYSYIFDTSGRLLFANQKLLALWGITLEQALGNDAFDLGYPIEDAQRIQAQVQSVFATGTPVKGELAYLSPTGVSGTYAYELTAAFAPDGSVDFVVGCSNDITQRKRAETALRDSASEFRALAESMPQIVWMTRPDGWNIYFNERWTDYTGLTPEESRGHGWSKPFHPDDRQRAQDAWLRAIATFTTYMLEVRLRQADGAYRWWLLRGVPQYDAAGTLVKWVGTCTDIHDLKSAELEVMRANQELKQQQTELRVLFDLMPALIMFKDADNRILRINQFGADVTGLRVDQIEGKLSHDIYPEVAEAVYAGEMEVMRAGQSQLGVVEKLRHRGKETWIQRDRVPYRDSNGSVIGLVVMVQDITQRKRDQDALRELNTDLEARVRQRTAELDLARSEAEAANRAKSDFLATMSHEIRTPMSGMLGLLELLELGELDAEHRMTLSVARDSGKALMRIIDDILVFSKIEANSLELNLEAGSIASVVINACRLHAQVAASKNLALGTDISAQIGPLLSFDPLRLGQILNNFINNAIKFTAAGRVDVSVELVGRHGDMEELRFIVRDTGIGMTPAQVDRLFQPFVQAAAETSAQFGGTGLGLVISGRLAELMGGTVEVESELGVGTSMTLRLPFEICRATGPVRSEIADQEALKALVAGRRAAPSVEAAQADGSLLLIVDDHPTNRMVLLRQAASLGYAAETADDGAQALAAWRSGRFAAILTDCSMPVMDGYQLACAIREAEAQHLGRHIPIIACTANALPSAAQGCFSSGMDACLVKPATLADLSAVLARWVPLPGERRAGEAAAAAPRAADARGQGLLDLVLLAEISGGDQLAQAEMLLDFRRVNASDACALRRAVAAQDFAAIAEYAHRIKGSCLMLGATLLAGVCARIEAAGAARDAADLGIAMGGFEVELLRLYGYLDMFPTVKK